MTQIYYRNGEGKLVTIDVSEEFAKTYRKELQKEWRDTAYQNYYSISLDQITDAGHDFADKRENLEENFMAHEDEMDKTDKLSILAAALATLSPDQRELVDKVYLHGEAQEDIAKQQNVCKQAISNRLHRIYMRLKKFFDKR